MMRKEIESLKSKLESKLDDLGKLQCAISSVHGVITSDQIQNVQVNVDCRKSSWAISSCPLNVCRMTQILLERVTNTTRRVLATNYEADEDVLMTEAGYLAASVTLLFIGFFGFFLNLCVIVLMWKDKQLWTPLNIILFNLVCSDFSVSILGNPWTLSSALSQRWIFGKTMCKMYGFFMAILGISSITSLAVLAYERYTIVSKPFRNHGLTRKGALYLVAGIWLYSLLLTVPPFLGWGKYVNEAANISCSVNWEEQSMNAMTYILYLFTFGLVVPMGVIVFSYLHIIFTMRKNQIRMGQTTKAEGRVTYMIFLMIVAFLLAWSPYAVFALLAQFGNPSLISPAAGVIPALLAKSSICYNPIIYVALNSQFRQVLKQVIGVRDREVVSNCETYAVGISRIASTAKSNETGNRMQMEQVREQNFQFNSARNGCQIETIVIDEEHEEDMSRL